MAESLVTMEQLPDDVLVALMQFLDLEDVLACRLVCKRLCGLALHRDVWGHRSLADDHPRAGAVLLLAPCLKMLTVTGRVPTLAVTSTWCAVACLRLRQGMPFNAPAFNPGEYAFIVYKQESLGRLRRLELCHLTCRMNTVADVLVRTVASCSGLESIDVLGYLPVTSHPVLHGPSRSSLTKFRCLVDDYSASFTNAILVGHAATLEEIHILAHDDFEEPATVALFAALPRLCSLRCNDSIRWLEAMAACSTLRDVFICLNKKLDRLERVAKFLRQASQLQRVHLENCAKGLTAEYCTELCEALAASSEQSHLERLALEGFQNVRPLLGVLPSLPALRHLDVTSATPDDALLKSITPATAPALRRLELGVESGQCPHAWVHGTAVEATLAENPALHILVRVWRSGRRRCGPDDCAACAEGCHREVKWNKVGKVGLYSHGPDECPSPEDHADDVDCPSSRSGKLINSSCIYAIYAEARRVNSRVRVPTIPPVCSIQDTREEAHPPILHLRQGTLSERQSACALPTIAPVCSSQDTREEAHPPILHPRQARSLLLSWAPMAESLVNMELLPDDVLITVLQFLDVEDVLACRLVCKRLCGLALDQYVWRHRSLADDHPRAGAVLLLAPCLKMLTVTGRVPTLAATTTGCAVESLELRSRDADPFSPAEYALAVLKQEALGRLRRLKVAGMDRGVSTGPDVLARTIASCSGLESLEVLGWLPELSRPIVRGPSAPSLTRFHCLANERAASFVYSILASHAPTLEEVSTGTDFPFQETVTAKFLAKLPRLRSLRCENPIGGLEAVAASPTLCEVSFELYPEDVDQLNIYLQFLRRAGHLRSVHLSNCAEGLFTDVLFAEVVEALLAGPSRHLERLALQGFKEVRPLLLALPLLRSLHHLDLDAEPDEDVLKGITPATAPALTLLELGQLPVGQCPHAWMHGAAVQAMLRQNPSLHVLLRLNTFSIMCDPQDCGSCVLACHKEVRWGWEEERKVSIGIFSHGPAQCPSPDDHTLAFDWQRGDDGKAMVTWIHM